RILKKIHDFLKRYIEKITIFIKRYLTYLGVGNLFENYGELSDPWTIGSKLFHPGMKQVL
ncbi:MAG: hypothetical protein K9J16_16815, partial [Melioribacteraceae bacterium]|nr:hypothetical protein [Melioribacteraceae bacterium]MCF8356497.1 hypothetical protein [Melioribacteraceae bacterium]MCF8395885.1 hypothetical protein [Melioribacteraceae bacterium]MCF8420952.1 hypothetical protein [Melioribacteraceae bacterium]